MRRCISASGVWDRRRRASSCLADTLFSALCSTWRLLFGVDSLQHDLLARYHDAGREPFFLTSAFPYAGTIRFYPKPLRPPTDETEVAKRWKGIRWVSERVLEQYLHGESIQLEMPTHNGKQSLVLHEGECLIHPDDRDALQ
ncbi:MAG: hypothetical protein NZL85_03630, partial [Fimbriimonadales bacterium]|nr:hypothetical protein [Fimbriimonadales bacterium]